MNPKLLKRLFLGFGTAFAVLIPGLQVARANGKLINHHLNIQDYKEIKNEATDPESTNYFKSSYFSLEEVTAAGEKLAKEVEANGLVLLKNDNNALPLSMPAPKVSVFGSGAVGINYTPSMSGGSVDTTKYKNFKQALEASGCSVNADLWNYYVANGGKRSNSVDGLVKTYMINETSWDSVKSANAASFSQYGDAAIVVLTRDSGEGFDVSSKGSDGRNGMYLGLSDEEINLLKGLTELKKAGIFKRVVVLLNSSCPIELNFLNDSDIDVDSIMWTGNVGGFGLDAVSEALVGKVNPSGKLSDTYVKDALSSPAMASWAMTDTGIFAQEYPSAKSFELNNTNKYYGAYVEGIYVGYRYYETRYEDFMLNKSNVGSFNYDDTVAYSFGHGLSYTTFEYSDFKMTENAKNKSFDIEVKVTNTGNVAGRETVQIYGQKPYIEGGLEKASVELMGFAKTKELKKNESEMVKISVKKEQFKSYDNVINKTYILDAGDYYLTAGRSAHDAVNNILSKKGKSVGNDKLVTVAFHQNELDKTTYPKSSATGKEITNQLDSYDINNSKNKGSNSVTYVSRGNWDGTFPKGKVSLDVNAEMAKDLASHKEIVENPEAKDPTYHSGEAGKLISLRGLSYDHELWDKLLNQLTYEEQAYLITNGAFGTVSLDTIALKGSKASDGPNFLTSTKTNVALPSEGIWASTFDVDLVKSVGDYLAEDARINGIDTLYGPGINIHRTPFIGRSNEYFSEDPFLTGICGMNEIQGLENKGVVAVVKHLAFNDEDSARNGISIWLNEQAAREIYLLPFEYSVGKNYGNGHGCMSGFNRAGCDWVGASNALQNVILREEFGYEGYFITDMASSNGALYMTFDDGIMAGTNIYLGSGSKTALKAYKSSLTFKNAVREATHRILYVLVNHSCIMSGIASDTIFVPITPWWDTTLVSLIIASGVVATASLGLAVFFTLRKKES